MSRLIVILMVSGLLFGCSAKGPTVRVPVIDRVPEESADEPAAHDVEIPGTVQELPAETSREGNPAVDVLVQTAEQQIREQQYGAASASLERAIRIAPKDPNLYLALARVRLQQGQKQQAGQLCKKAITLADDGGYIRYQCQQLLVF